MSATDIGLLSDFVSGQAALRRVNDRALVVVRIEDSIYVLNDRCSHEEFSLSLGEVDEADCTIECERHGAVFDLRSGKPLSLPATQPVPVYEASVRDGRVLVDVGA